MVCGDCCTLSTGGATTFAVCSGCAKRGGASLGTAWMGLLGWMALVVGVLVAIGVVIAMLR